MQAEENIQHLFQECTFAKECWKLLISPLEIRINTENPLPNFLQTLGKAYPYTKEKKVTIQKIWKCILVVLCWKIWFTQNKCILKNQIPRIGKTLSKTWGFTSKILNVKGKHQHIIILFSRKSEISSSNP